MKRAGETLIEIVVAMSIFGIMMSGMFEFMAGQTHSIAKINEHDRTMYYAQKFVNYGSWAATSEDKVLDVKFIYGDDTLKVQERSRNKNVLMTFKIQ